MSFLRSPAVALGLLAAAGACTIGTAWAGDGQPSKLHPWVLVAGFWGAALLSVLMHYLVLYLARAADWTRRAWHQHAPARARLVRSARLASTLAVARAAAWARFSTLALGEATGSLLGHLRRQVRGRATLARAVALAGQAWEAVISAGARRTPAAVIGWSRSARKALRVWTPRAAR